MYLIQIDWTVYAKRDGSLYTLVEAMREVYGVRNAKVLRANGEMVVRDAGSTSNPWVHVPSGRRIRHRLTRWAREDYLARMAWHNAQRRNSL